MNPKLVAVVTLRSLATLFGLAGQPRPAAALSTIADAAEAGINVDDHMQRVADTLKESAGDVTGAQWDDVHARIAADSARLQAR